MAPSKLLTAAAACGIAIAVALVMGPRTEAHKAITSKYTYNEHVFPILKERCARCHYPGGPTPMALTTYQDAMPWAESIREQLVGEMMPPWFADATGPAVKGGHSITTKELDILVTWAVGGSPQGPLGSIAPVFTAPTPQWGAGQPDLAVEMPSEFVVKAGTIEQSQEFVLTTGLKEEKWVSNVDLLPGTPSMVRSAVVSLEDGTVLATWVPGHQPIAAPNGTAFKLPAGARLKLQMHYRKHYSDEQNDRADKSSVGLYFSEAPLSGRALQGLQIDGPPTEGASLEPLTFSAPLKTAARIVALRPSFEQSYEWVEVVAVVGARRVPLLKLHAAQPQWYRRYWLAEPVELPAGATIEVRATPQENEFALITQKKYPLAVGLDFVAQ